MPSKRDQTQWKRHLEWTEHLFISRWPHLVIGATALNGFDSLVAQRKWVMSLQKSFTPEAGGNKNTYHCFCGNQPVQPSSCATWSLIYGVNRKHCLQQHRCWTNSWGIDFGIWPNWWHHYVDWISLSRIRMLYVESQGRESARTAWLRKRKEMQLPNGIFLLGRMPSVFKHYVVIFLMFVFCVLFLLFFLHVNITITRQENCKYNVDFYISTYLQ